MIFVSNSRTIEVFMGCWYQNGPCKIAVVYIWAFVLELVIGSNI